MNRHHTPPRWQDNITELMIKAAGVVGFWGTIIVAFQILQDYFSASPKSQPDQFTGQFMLIAAFLLLALVGLVGYIHIERNARLAFTSAPNIDNGVHGKRRSDDSPKGCFGFISILLTGLLLVGGFYGLIPSTVGLVAVLFDPPPEPTRIDYVWHFVFFATTVLMLLYGYLLARVIYSDSSSVSRKSARFGKYTLQGSYPANWHEIRQEVLQRDNHRCGNCGSMTNLHVHHIVPLSLGGSNDLGNLRTLCRSCHTKLHPHMRD